MRGLRALVVLCVVAAMAMAAPALSRTLDSRGTSHVLLGADNDTSTPFNLVSLPALIAHRYDGRALRVGAVLARELAFTRYAVSYRSGRLTVTGVMTVPTRPGRHPVVVIAHGYERPERYHSGGMLVREQSYLAQNGFVAFQIDYRNFAGSSRETGRPVARPLGYPADLVNAVRAVKRARLPFVNASKVVLLGRSMGGGVVLNALAAQPHLARAAVLYSPVSSLAADTYQRWVLHDRALRHRVTRAYGSPRTRPALWRQASSRDYFSRIAVPIQIDHGTADPVCPLSWSLATTGSLRAHGKQVRLFEYPGERHRFHDDAWRLFMRRAVAFYRATLR